MATKTKIHKNFITVTQRLLALIERGTIPWHRPWHNINYQNLLTQKPYSGINPIICQLDSLYFNYQSPYFIGSGQCRDKGWQIKKGSKSTWLRYGGTKKVMQTVEDETGKTTEKERFIRTFKWLQVFNLDCVEDKNSQHKIEDYLPPNLSRCPEPVEKERAIEKFVRASGVEIVYGGNQAYHILQTNKIYLPYRYQFSKSDRFWATLFHELGHWTGAETRLNRVVTGDKNDPAYHFEELVADLTSSFLGNEFELDDTQLEHHASYIEHYWRLLKLDSQIFFKANYEAQKAASYLLELNRFLSKV